MVIVLDANAALTPAGKPVAVPMPVAPVVVWVMLVSAVLIHNVGDDDAELTVLFGVTVTVNEQVAVRPQASVAVHVTSVLPTLKTTPFNVE